MEVRNFKKINILKRKLNPITHDCEPRVSLLVYFNLLIFIIKNLTPFNYSKSKNFIGLQNNLYLNDNTVFKEKEINYKNIKNNFSTLKNININYNKNPIKLFNPQLKPNLNEFRKKINSNINDIDLNEIGSKSNDACCSEHYTMTSNGSYVSIHSNKINGFPILKGVCAKCINTELIKLKEIKTKINKIKNLNNYDLMQIQEQRDNELKNRINSKVDQIKKLSELAKQKTFPNIEKNKLIDSIQKEECKFYIPSNDPIKNKVIERFNQKQKLILNQKPIPYNIDVENYLLKNNPATKLSIPNIGLNNYYNKYVLTPGQYRNWLDNQILYKEQVAKIEKLKDQKLENDVYNKNLIEDKNLYEAKQNYMMQLRKDFLTENKKLMEEKQRQIKLDRSRDIALEQQRLKCIAEEEKNELLKSKNKKYRIRKELLSQLDQQIKLKKCKSISSMNNNLNITDGNIYREKKNNEQFGRCVKCLKILRKNRLSPTEEYEIVKENKIENENELYKLQFENKQK